MSKTDISSYLTHNSQPSSCPTTSFKAKPGRRNVTKPQIENFRVTQLGPGQIFGEEDVI